MVIILLFFILHWYLSLFAQTFFHHRYAAHRAFTMSKGWEKFFFVYSYFLQGSSYMSPRVYAILHRMHHAYTDTELDPHSPSYDSNVLKMMWRTSYTYVMINKNKFPVEERFLKNVPQRNWLDWWGNTWYSRVMWAGLYTAFYVAFAPSAWWYVLIPIHIAMGPIHGAIINWAAHKYGETNYEVDNTSKNLFKIDWLMLGEGYHNNHHKHPARSNFASRRGEFDPVFPVIRLLHKWKVIRINQPVAVAEYPA